jgi:hypothetical protein
MTMALLVQGYANDTTPAVYAILAVGFGIVTAVGGVQLLGNIKGERANRQRTVDMLRSADPRHPEFVHVLREAFAAFDTDHSGDISIAELREMLEILFPHASRVQLGGAMKEAKHFATKENTFFEAAFVDAVVLAVKSLQAHEQDINYVDTPPPVHAQGVQTQPLRWFRGRVAPHED